MEKAIAKKKFAIMSKHFEEKFSRMPITNIDAPELSSQLEFDVCCDDDVTDDVGPWCWRNLHWILFVIGICGICVVVVILGVTVLQLTGNGPNLTRQTRQYTETRNSQTDHRFTFAFTLKNIGWINGFTDHRSQEFQFLDQYLNKKMDDVFHESWLRQVYVRSKVIYFQNDGGSCRTFLDVYVLDDVTLVSVTRDDVRATLVSGIRDSEFEIDENTVHAATLDYMLEIDIDTENMTSQLIADKMADNRIEELEWILRDRLNALYGEKLGVSMSDVKLEGLLNDERWQSRHRRSVRCHLKIQFRVVIAQRVETESRVNAEVIKETLIVASESGALAGFGVTSVDVKEIVVDKEGEDVVVEESVTEPIPDLTPIPDIVTSGDVTASSDVIVTSEPIPDLVTSGDVTASSDVIVTTSEPIPDLVTSSDVTPSSDVIVTSEPIPDLVTSGDVTQTTETTKVEVVQFDVAVQFEVNNLTEADLTDPESEKYKQLYAFFTQLLGDVYSTSLGEQFERFEILNITIVEEEMDEEEGQGQGRRRKRSAAGKPEMMKPHGELLLVEQLLTVRGDDGLLRSARIKALLANVDGQIAGYRIHGGDIVYIQKLNNTGEWSPTDAMSTKSRDGGQKSLWNRIKCAVFGQDC